jgi:glutamate carboxypeptidase
MHMNLPSTEALLEGIRSWVEIESQTADVEGVNRMMDAVSAEFEKIGAQVERIPGKDGRGDLISIETDTSGGGSNTGILVLSHLDTVHPRGTLEENPWRIEGDRAYGPGTFDMKGGAYLGMMAYMSMLQDGVKPNLPVRFLYVPDEEVGSRTSRPVIEAAADRAKYVLVTEPARHGGKVVTGRKGTARYRLYAHGRASHSGSQHSEGRSAIKEIARHIVEIEGWTDYDRELTLNIGQVYGGTTDNTIPEFCTAHIDVRAATPADLDETEARIRALKPYDPDVSLRVEGQINRPPYKKNAGIEGLFQHAKALASDIGFELEDTATGGGSDGSFAAERVPTLDGLGVCGANAHQLNEYLEISSLHPRLKLMRRLMETLS